MKYDVVVPDTIFGKDGSKLYVLSSGNTWEEATADLKLYLLDGIECLIRLNPQPLN